MNPSLYLAGPIAGASYQDTTDWRQALQGRLTARGITVYSPMRGKGHLEGVTRLDSGHGPEHPLCTREAIFHRDRFDVERCSALLVNLLGATEKSTGTIMEIAWAHLLHKPVIVVMEKQGNPHDDHAMLSLCMPFRAATLEDGLDLACAVLLP